MRDAETSPTAGADGGRATTRLSFSYQPAPRVDAKATARSASAHSGTWSAAMQWAHHMSRRSSGTSSTIRMPAVSSIRSRFALRWSRPTSSFYDAQLQCMSVAWLRRRPIDPHPSAAARRPRMSADCRDRVREQTCRARRPVAPPSELMPSRSGCLLGRARYRLARAAASRIDPDEIPVRR
jgi:hypothetical protein